MKGVLLMAYGGPASLDQVEAYYTHIRRGTKPTKEQLDDLVARYVAIGGGTPLLAITRSQAAALELALKSRGGAKVFAGMKHSPPFVADVMAKAKAEGVTELLCVALAPHYSGIGVGGYARAVDEANSRLGGHFKVTFVNSWHDNPGLVSMWAGRIGEAAKSLGPDASVVFSAHSLPERIIREGDPYKVELLETSDLVARAAGLKDWTFAFQSQSKTGEPWLGPDILDHLQTLFDAGKRKFISAPIGFVSDHLEVLYDIDVECRGWAKERGAELVRCRSPNDSPEMVAALVQIAEANGFA
ncbi:MAG: ferrochelatase [Nitrososphaerota archaeon]|nr:ferrochelatase [Nitrososphaerota archaeon]